MSEAAKIARYNIQLLENIYKAYEPEQADHVVKIFRKGGIFNIVPIIEEEGEDSIDTCNQEIMPYGAGTNCFSGAPDLESQTTETNKDPNGLNGKLSSKDVIFGSCKLGDIKEENSQFLDDLVDDKFKNNCGRENSQETGYDFDENKNKNAYITGGLADDFGTKAFEVEGNESDDWRGNKYANSSSFDEETPLGGIGLNERKKRKKRRLKKKKKDPFNAKIKQLEEIYDVKLNDENATKGTKSQFGGEFTSRNAFNSRRNVSTIKREKTVKLSESISPRNFDDTNTPVVTKMTNTHQDWRSNKNKVGIK